MNIGVECLICEDLTKAEKYAQLLGYNYQSGDWYEKTYKIFNKQYSKVKLKKIDKKNNSILKRFKSLIN